MKKDLIILLVAFFIFSCSGNKTGMPEFSDLTEQLSSQLKVLVDHIPPEKVPRSYPDEDGGYRMVRINDWTCGFPAGSFWYMYELTGDIFWKEVALENSLKLEEVQYRTNTHDLGFMVFCSYGNALRLTGNEDYKEVILKASESLLTRFNPSVGCIKSWDHGDWQFPVIIDNMMNLEMLFWASEVSGNSKFREAAISHADVTLENHFRDDWSSLHVVSYDTITGEPVEKVTHQGLSNESAWGRGQAWGLYGFTMTYRETTDEKYLNVAENIAGFILNNLPEDMIFYWDFNDPKIPGTNRDASTAAITASALFELSVLADNGQKYLDAANKIVESLTSVKYRATGGTNGGFILKHSVGHKPNSSEVDVAINYADYYYLEALKRQQNLIKE
jgi:unsaturated chondroitin disaccharide hydrolase